jgi:hypothetical protein
MESVLEYRKNPGLFAPNKPHGLSAFPARQAGEQTQEETNCSSCLFFTVHRPSSIPVVQGILSIRSMTFYASLVPEGGRESLARDVATSETDEKLWGVSIT